MALGYREHAPAPELAGHIECYWTFRCRVDPADTEVTRVLPDGCMDLLFSLGDPARGPGGVSHGATVVGTMTRPMAVTQSGKADLLGVRFHPAGAMAFVDVPASRLTDGVAALGDVWGPSARVLWERLGEAPTLGERFTILDHELRSRLGGGRRLDDAVLHASQVLAVRHGGVSVDDLATASGLGRRQLERRFLAVVGLPPRTACRVARFRSAVARLHADPLESLVRVALAAGYYDQPHFTREFGTLAGVPPGAYRSSLSAVPEDAFVQDG